MKTCIIIPAFNEEKAIGDLIKQIRDRSLDVMVIDDGSQDNTFEIAKRSGALLFRNQKNEGKGASLIKGFSYALDNGYDAVITMDGDGQHHVDDIPKFIDLAESSDGGIFIGNRMDKTKSMPWLRIHTNKIMSWFISSVAKQKILDSQCGFRLIKREVLEKISLNSAKYEIESEMLIKAAKTGFKIEPVPIETIYTGQVSQIHPIVDTLRFFRFLFKEVWILRS